jgi:hypothetical protein
MRTNGLLLRGARLAARLLAAGLSVMLLGTLTGARRATGFGEDDVLTYGMSLADAEKVVGKDGKSKDWVIVYRIDTTQTCDVACVYQKTTYYRLGFYQGTCYSLEKRAEVPGDSVESVFARFKEINGETPENAHSADGSLMFARWALKTRDVALTAQRRDDGTYTVTYEEVDPIKRGDALHARESEMQNTPMEVDPITGKPRPVTHGQDQQSGGENGGDEGKSKEPKKSGDDEGSGGGDDNNDDDGDGHEPIP